MRHDLFSMLVVAWALAGCGGAPTPGTTTPAPARAYRPCANPAHVRFAADVCFDPVGSRWRVTSNAPGGRLDFEVELMAGGRVRATDHPAASPGTDEWFVEDDELRIFLANRYVEYRGRFTNGSVVVGEAANVRGDRWDWRADRIRGARRCAGNELITNDADEPGCYSAAGSRWTITVGGRSFVVMLAANGTVNSEDPEDATPNDDTWEQEGSTLRLRFDGGARVFEGRLEASNLARWNGTSPSGPFTAEAVPNYAGPPY